jgi:hypothetical protein
MAEKGQGGLELRAGRDDVARAGVLALRIAMPNPPGGE